MENGRITGRTAIDLDGQGNLFLSRDNIVISDDANDVVCLVPYEPEGDECAEYQQLAEQIVARLNVCGSDDLVEGLSEALESYVECNCGPVCEGSCTHAKLTRAWAILNDRPAAAGRVEQR